MDIVFKLSDETRAVLEQMQDRRKTRTDRIRDMFVEVLPHQERNDKPTVPSEAAIRLQTRIDAEEFVEKIDALYDDPDLVGSLKKILHAIAKYSTIRKDLHARLPEFAKELADNVVTNEGFAVLFGIDLERVFALTHASNMSKKDGPIVNDKRMKPEGWKAPDVAGELVHQGWKPLAEAEVDTPIPYTIAPSSISHGADWPECKIHGYHQEIPCSRCENAQYNGSEIDPLGEQSEEEPIAKDEPIHLMLGLVKTSGNFGIGGSLFSASFTTRDASLINRCRLYCEEKTKVVAELNGSVAAVSRIYDVSVRPSDVMESGLRVALKFRRAD